jgi:FkbM family methyltransferase
MIVQGIHLPDGETHLKEHMAGSRVLVDGKGTYQYRKLSAGLQLLTRKRLAVDIGAHVGLWSRILVKEFDWVEAFEPVHGDWFVRNVALDKCRLHRVALGETTGRVDFQVPIETTGNTHVAIAGPHPGTRGVAHPERVTTVLGVPMFTLDSLGLKDVDFVKIDVEGVERAVVAGAEATIKTSRPIVILEQKGNEGAYGDEPKAALKLLQSWGMKVHTELSGDFILAW